VIDLKNDFTELKNGEHHTDWLNRMANHITDDGNKFVPPDIGFTPRSLISVVMPCRKAILQFCYRGKQVNCIVPPVPGNFYKNHDRVFQYLYDYLSAKGYSAVKAATLPHKLLAVHCGLGQYGRNNICYNDEFGSYINIMTYFSDMECDNTTWFPIRRMDICENCYKCLAACPTKAIDKNHRLISSDRCITYYNENPGEFPDWMDKSVHNCIVGCMMCQDCCPANTHNINNEEAGIVFTEQETTELLSNKGDMPYSDSLAEKIENTSLPSEFTTQDILPRNLAALLWNI